MVEAGTTIGGLYVKTGVETGVSPPPPPPPPNLLGPFETILKFSGMDCSRTRKENIRSVRGVLSLSIAIFIFALVFVEMVLFMQIDEKPFSIGWAESTVYGFMALSSLLSVLSLISWTRENFISQFEDTLSRLRGMRLSTSQKIDDYSVYHRTAAIMIIPIFLVTLTTSFYSSVTNRYALHSNSTFSSDSPIFLIAPFIDLFGCIATSLAVVIYVTVNVALNREVIHFNKELTNSARFQQLTLPQVLNTYSKRHSDIIQLIRFANGHLCKLGAIVPLFTLTSLINCFYILGSFKSTIPTFNLILIGGWALISAGITIACLSSPAKLQDNIQETAEILIHDDVLQTCGDDQMHHTYRVTLDRCLHSNSKLMFLNAFGIDSQNFNRLMFLVPNISAAMVIYRDTHLF